jgi:tRNA (guanosine-2'-O-)-methyltransferase
MRNSRFERIAATLNRRQPDLTIAMENVHKTRNLGALARTCDAVGIGTIHAIAPDPTGIKLGHKTAGGTEKWMTLCHHQTTTSACEEFQRWGLNILAAGVGADAIDFRSIDYRQPTVVIVGSELDGLSNDALEKADQRIQIPLMGMVESLNVSVATGIILYEAARQRDAAGLYERRRIGDGEYNQLLFEWLHPGVARFCQSQGRAYPDLDGCGEIQESVTGNRREGLKALNEVEANQSGCSANVSGS